MSQRVCKTAATIGLAATLATGAMMSGAGTASASSFGEGAVSDWKDGTAGYKLGCTIANALGEKVCGELYG